MTPEPSTLRERHRRDTRRRIAEAAYAIASQKGMGQLKAEAIAERAGVSRRSFFNYVPSAEAALSLPIEDFLEAVRQNFLARPAGEDVFEAMAGAISAVDPELVERLGQVSAVPGGSEASARYQLAAWDRYERAVAEILARRLGKGADPLYVATLAAAVMGAGRVAVCTWAALKRAPRRAGAPRRSPADLTGFFVRAVRFLGASFSRAKR